MIKDKAKQQELEMLVGLITKQLRDYNVSSNLTQLKQDSIFALGAQMLYVGQALTELSGFKLEPASQDGRLIVSKIVALLEIATINPEIIGQFLTEPNGCPFDDASTKGNLKLEEAK